MHCQVVTVSGSVTVKDGARLRLGDDGAVTLGCAGGIVSRVQLTVVVEVLPAASVAVTTSV